MKVIGINGSPRKNGNTETLVQAVLDAAKEKGHTTELFNLNELEFCGCQACMYCKSHDHCKLDDGLTQVLDAVKDADAIVFGAPIYMWQLSGQFKLFEDRLYMFLLRPAAVLCNQTSCAVKRSRCSSTRGHASSWRFFDS